MKSEPSSLINVLVISGGGFQGLAVVKGLLQAGNIRVVVADCYEENIGRYLAHRSYVVPLLAQAEELHKALLRICKAEDIRVIIPSTELELEFLAVRRRDFEARGIQVAVSSKEFLQSVCNKERLYELLKDEKLAGPKGINLGAGKTSYPILGKPKSGWGGKGQIVIHAAGELKHHALDELRKGYVWQPFLRKFVEYSADFAIGFAGHISEICLRERVRVSGGFAIVARERRDASVTRLVTRFARMAARRGGLGIFNVQVIRAGGRCFISDVNPRIGTSAVFNYGMRVNLPAFVCSSGNRPDGGRRPATRKSVTMVRYLEELFVQDERLDGIRGVVMDLDDTLINQKRWILDKLRGVHARFRSKLPAKEMFLARAMAILEEGNRSKLIDALCEAFHLGPGLREHLIQAYREFRPTNGHVFADVQPVLSELKRRGYKLAILTNNPPESQRQKIAACGLAKYFDAVVYARELGAEKPDARGYRHVASQLKLSPGKLVMVGDHLYGDIGGALNSGYGHAFFITRPGGFHNFDPGIFAEVSGCTDDFTTIQRLGDVLRHLRPVK